MSNDKNTKRSREELPTAPDGTEWVDCRETWAMLGLGYNSSKHYNLWRWASGMPAVPGNGWYPASGEPCPWAPEWWLGGEDEAQVPEPAPTGHRAVALDLLRDLTPACDDARLRAAILLLEVSDGE